MKAAKTLLADVLVLLLVVLLLFLVFPGIFPTVSRFYALPTSLIMLVLVIVALALPRSR